MVNNDVIKSNIQYHSVKKDIKMRIAICDNDMFFAKQLKLIISKFAKEKQINFYIDTYSGGEKLVNTSDVYDLIFLDYEIDGHKGIEIAKLLRAKKVLSSIIFVTSYPGFIIDAFKVITFRFCTKPISENDIFKVLDAYFKRYGYDFRLILSVKKETISVHTKDITFIETNQKHCIINLENGRKINCAMSMKDVFNLLPQYHFYRIHRSYVVNFNYIERYNKNAVYLKNGISTPYVGKTYWNDFQLSFKKHSIKPYFDDSIW